MTSHGWGRVRFLVALVWIAKSFWSAEEAALFLNELPLERALEAKVFCASASPCYLVYRAEAKAQ